VTTEDLWSTFADRLLAFVRSRVGAQEADDVVQKVFLRIHKALSRGDSPANAEAWVFKIARNAIIDHRRKAGSDRSEPLGDQDPPAPDDLQDDAVRDLSGCVRPMLHTLPKEQAEALRWNMDGMTQADAAKRAGISVSGMKTRVQRGRKQLADSMIACCVAELDARGVPVDWACDC